MKKMTITCYKCYLSVTILNATNLIIIREGWYVNPAHVMDHNYYMIYKTHIDCVSDAFISMSRWSDAFICPECSKHVTDHFVTCRIDVK